MSLSAANAAVIAKLFTSYGPVTLLMYWIKSYDGQEASRIVKLLKPNLVIPVHFASGKKINEECDFSNADLFIENMKDFKVKYVGKEFQIKPKRMDQNTIYIFSD